MSIWRSKKGKLFFASFLPLVLLGGLFFTTAVLAQSGDTFGLQEVGGNVALGDEDIRVTIAKIIRGMLGLLGVVAISIVLYGGFTYMTAGGNEEKVASAKKILVNGLIGLAIILSSFAITQFVITKLGQATGALDGDGTAVSGPSPCGDWAYAYTNAAECGGGAPVGPSCVDKTASFVVKSVTPVTDDTTVNNIVIRAIFNKPLASTFTTPQALASALEIRRGTDLVNDQFEYSALIDKNGNAYGIEAVRKVGGYECTDSDEWCVEPGAYTIKIANTLQSKDGKTITTETDCGETYPLEYSFTASTSATTDTVAPNVDLLVDGEENPSALVAGNTYVITAPVSDNSGAGYVYFSIKKLGQTKPFFDYFDGPAGNSGSDATNQNPYTFTHNLTIPKTLTKGEYELSVAVTDIDHQTTTKTISVTVQAEHCNNNAQDGDETGVDVGGSCGNEEGGTCTAHAQCGYGLACVSGTCAKRPLITDVDPMNGASGNWITISGANFGSVPGKVQFGLEGTANWVDASLVACGGNGNSWTNSYVIVEVPEISGRETSSIRVIVADTNTSDEVEPLSDSTTDSFKPKKPLLNDGYFAHNTIKRPGLCSVVVAQAATIGEQVYPAGGTQAPPPTPVIAAGKSFGSAQGNDSTLSFGGIQAPVSGWTDAQVNSSIPQNMNGGDVSVAITVNGEKSNGVPFTVVDPNSANLGPKIISIDPGNITRGSYFTISGSGFGKNIGSVWIADSKSAVLTCGSGTNDTSCRQLNVTDFPEGCVNTWTDSKVVAEMWTNSLTNKEYYLVVKTATGVPTSGNETVTIVDGTAPSICAIVPSSGPAPTPTDASLLKIYGKNFSNGSSVYFWRQQANANDLTTWLTGHKSIMQVEKNGTLITTPIPVKDGYSMTTGPIKVINNNSTVSNGVLYEVNDCRTAASGVKGSFEKVGYQCCASGPDTGRWVAGSCAGEERTGGYVWRFTTGIIPEVPRVVEYCEDDSAEFPSPTPRALNAVSGVTDVCLNTQVAVRFNLDMNESSFNKDTVKVYSCGTGSAPDCDTKDTESRIDSATSYTTNVLRIYPQDKKNLDPNTWYRVELTTAITSAQEEFVLGDKVTTSRNLLATRACADSDDSTAYCYEFRTGAGECQLTDVGINPPKHTTKSVGRVFKSPASSSPLYYTLWGKGSQTCSVVDVDQHAWDWDTSATHLATVTKAPLAPYQNNTRATVDALQHTAPDAVTISAQADIGEGNAKETFTGESDLIIELEDPKVASYWPNCTESCLNAGIGVTFNREMVTAFYKPFISDSGVNSKGITLSTCADEFCTSFVQTVSLEPDMSGSDTRTFRAQPINLQPNTWYKVDVTPSLRAIAGYIKNSDGTESVMYGKGVEPFSWKFKTQNTLTPCVAASVRVTPDPFVATTIGEKKVYSAFPYSEPNACNTKGQELNPWDYGWAWSIKDNLVAKITTFSFSGEQKSYCDLGCVLKGSVIKRSAASATMPLCGNGVVDAGEDCDIAGKLPNGQDEQPGRSCSFSCLRPGNVADTCGDGELQPELGEECDEGGDKNKWQYCTNSCTNKGSTTATPGTNLSQSLCGSGTVTAGEECDTADPATQANCSASCLRTGTSLSQSWCGLSEAGGLAANHPQYAAAKAACMNAVSVCGNNVVELGEECEAVGANTLRVRSGDMDSQDITVENPLSHCTTSCKLNNICNVAAIPQGLRCNPEEEGCNPTSCTLLGASLGYSTPSQCGDKSIGIGEYVQCEAVAASSLGQAPKQVVTAVGGQTVKQSSTKQTTEVVAQINKVRKQDGTMEDISPILSGDADYTLMCGFTEYVEPQVASDDSLQFNDCSNNTDNDLGVASNTCCYPRPKRTSAVPQDGTGLGNSQGVCRNTAIEVGFSGEIDRASLTGNIILASGHPAGHVCADGEVNVTESALAHIASNTPSEEGNVFERVWRSVKQFFAGIFGSDVQATEYGVYLKNNSKVWCSGGVNFTTDVTTHTNADNVVTSSTVSLTLTKALAPNTQYMVLLKGGKDGITNATGVGIKVSGTSLTDSFAFMTRNELCSVDEVTVTPAQHLFTVRDAQHKFLARALTSNGEPIVSTEEYAWNWSWGPQNNPIFEIPVTAGETATKSAASATLASRNLEGKVSALAIATIVADTAGNTVNTVVSGKTDLVAAFCENIWKVGENPFLHDEEYHFKMSYCADAGQSNNKADDLPYLSMVRLNKNQVEEEGVLTKYLLTSDKNADAIGVQVIQNQDNKTAARWFADKFGSTAGLRAVTVDGYEGVSDGNTYYINALNVDRDESTKQDTGVYGNIYVFSLNVGASESTRQVFDRLLNSLEFNTNLTNFGYCGSSITQPNYSGTPIACTNDSQCVQNSSMGTVCAAEKTKLQRDWKRLGHTKIMQENLEAYRAKNGDYPALVSGSFIPGYTSTRWPSWGALGSAVGTLPVDPVNTWFGCNGAEDQTCWNAGTSEFICPDYASVYEYKKAASAEGYMLHVPLEYFDGEFAKSVFGGTYIPNLNSFTTQRSCQPAQKLSALGGSCGDGLVNPATEQCDPVGSTKVVKTKKMVSKSCPVNGGPCVDNYVDALVQHTCNTSCQWESGTAVNAGMCGNGVVESGEKCDDGSKNDTYGHCAADCSGLATAGFCGNKKVDPGVELCDASTGATSLYAQDKEKSCSWDCQAVGSFCGDGVVNQTDGETCDDGNKANADGCSATCKMENLACYARVVKLFDTSSTTTRVFLSGGDYVKNDVVTQCFASGTTGNSICQMMNLNGCQKIEIKSANGTSPVNCNDDLSTLTTINGNVDTTLYCNGKFEYTAITGLPASPVSAEPGSCGDGVVNPGELCDVGSNNGLACNPEYGKSCSYCANDCKKVLTKEAVAFCGNTVLDPGGVEVCDMDKNGKVLALTNNQSTVQVCPDKGEYTCSNSCSMLANNCLTCGKLDGKPVPKLAILNPLTSNGNSPYSDLEYVNLFRQQTNGAYANLGYRKINSIGGAVSEGTGVKKSPYIDPTASYYLFVDTSFKPELNKGLETNLLCKDDYKLFYNTREINKKLYGSETARTAKALAEEGRGDFFDYSVAGEGTVVENDTIMSPAVPPKVYRVVVRWTGAEDAINSSFVGSVYSVQSVTSRVTIPFKQEDVCATMTKDGLGYWMPTAACKNTHGVYSHPHISTQTKKTFVQSFTIDTQQTNSLHYAFLVQSINGAPMAMQTGANITVEVYEARSNQVPEYSIYKPVKTFSIKTAKGTSTNSLAKYWHVFNLSRTTTGGYTIVPVESIESSECEWKNNKLGLESAPSCAQ